MPLVVDGRPVLAAQVVRVDRAAAERNLIVVGIVVGLRQRVGGAEPEPPREPPRHLHQQGVVIGFGARLEIHDAIGPADDGIEHRADGSAR